jgi:hypothetical protein
LNENSEILLEEGFMNLARFWAIFFTVIAVSYIVQILLIVKGVNEKKNSKMRIIVLATLPIFLFIMWSNGVLSSEAKLINTIIGCSGLCAGMGYLYLRQKRRGK